MATLRSLPTPAPIVDAETGLARRENPAREALTRNVVRCIAEGAPIIAEMPTAEALASREPVSDVLPYNAVTREQYKGGNIVRLAIAEVEHNYGPGGWAGFKQWLTVGRVVRKGEKSTAIGRVFTKKNEQGETVGTGFSGARVFHFDQTTELEQNGGE